MPYLTVPKSCNTISRTNQMQRSAREVTTMRCAAEQSRWDAGDDRTIGGHNRRPLDVENRWRQPSSVAAHTTRLSIHHHSLNSTTSCATQQ